MVGIRAYKLGKGVFFAIPFICTILGTRSGWPVCHSSITVWELMDPSPNNYQHLFSFTQDTEVTPRNSHNETWPKKGAFWKLQLVRGIAPPIGRHNSARKRDHTAPTNSEPARCRSHEQRSSRDWDMVMNDRKVKNPKGPLLEALGSRSDQIGPRMESQRSQMTIQMDPLWKLFLYNKKGVAGPVDAKTLMFIGF